VPDHDPLEFTLLENGLDFIWSALEHLDASTSKRDLKYAVLHLAAGIELTLKERLRREDWKLLYQDTAKASEETYRSGSFVSVRFDTCLQRLATDCDVEFSDDQEDALQAMREKRNRLEHLALVDSPAAVIAVAAEARVLIVDFVADHLDDTPLSDVEESLLTQIRAKLPDLTAFVDARQRGIADNLKAAYAILPCPACLQEALSIDDGVRCLFCGYTNSADEAAHSYATEVLGASWYEVVTDGAEWPIRLCPSCESETCVDADDRGYLCFGCGAR
jgi:hypothetical protein